MPPNAFHVDFPYKFSEGNYYAKTGKDIAYEIRKGKDINTGEPYNIDDTIMFAVLWGREGKVVWWKLRKNVCAQYLTR